MLCGKAAYTAKFDTIAHHHRSMQSTLFTGYRQPVCVVHTNACICERTHTLYTQNRPDLESQFGIRRPIILMIFLFALYHSLLLVFLLSILAVSMCTFCGFHDKKKKNDSTSLGKKMPHFPLKPVAKIPCPRERWQMTNDGATRLLLYSA